MKQRLIQKAISISLVASMLASNLMYVGATDVTFSDMPEDYSTSAIENAVSNGLLVGNEGKVYPEDSLTRAEMASIFVRAFKGYDVGDLSNYNDVSADAWYAEHVAIAYDMHILEGDGSSMYPDDAITRQEVFQVIYSAFGLMAGDSDVLNDFEDVDEVSDWAVDAASALVALEIVYGDENGNLNPQDYITRKDFAVIMDRLIQDYVTEEGEYIEFIDGTIVITTGNVTLSDITITGNLVLADGVAADSVTLINVTVGGELIIRGEGSVSISGTSSYGGITILSEDGDLDIAGDADVGSMHVADRSTSYAVHVGSGVTVGDVYITHESAEPDLVEDFGETGTITYYEEDGSVKVVITFDSTSSSGSSSSSGSGGSGGSTTTYYVTFDYNDGVTSSETSSVQENYTVTEPADPTREGYTFLGWSLSDAETAYDFTTTVTSAFTLYAQWELIDSGTGNDTTGDDTTGDDTTGDDTTGDDTTGDDTTGDDTTGDDTTGDDTTDDDTTDDGTTDDDTTDGTTTDNCAVSALVTQLEAEIDKLEALIIEADLSSELETALLGLAGQLEIELTQELEKLIDADCDGETCTCDTSEIEAIIEKGLEDIAALEELIASYDELKDYVESGEFSDEMEDALNKLLVELEQAIIDGVDEMTQALDDLYNSDDVQQAIQDIENAIDDLLELIDTVESAVQDAIDKLEELQNYLESDQFTEDMEQALDELEQAIIDGIDEMTQALDDLYNSDDVQQAIQDIKDIIDEIETAIEELQAEIESGLEGLQEEVESTLGDLQDTLDKLEADLEEALDELYALLDEIDTESFAALSAIVESIEETIAEVEAKIAAIEAMTDALKSGNLADISAAMGDMGFVFDNAALTLNAMDGIIDTLLTYVEEDSDIAEILTEMSNTIDTLTTALETAQELYDAAQEVLDYSSIFIESITLDVSSNGDIAMTITAPETSVEEMVEELVETLGEDVQATLLSELLSFLSTDEDSSTASTLLTMAETLSLEIDIDLLFTIMEYTYPDMTLSDMLSYFDSDDSILSDLFTINTILELAGVDDDTMTTLEDLLGEDTLNSELISFTEDEENSGVYTLAKLSLVTVEDLPYAQDIIDLVEALGFEVDFEALTLTVKLDLSNVSIYDPDEELETFWDIVFGTTNSWWYEYEDYLSDNDVTTLTELAADLSEQYTVTVLGHTISEYTVDPADLYLLSVYYGLTADKLVDYMEYDGVLDSFYTYAAYSAACLTASYANYYLVTFDVNGGDEMTINSQWVMNGNAVLAVANPTNSNDGLSFAGWYNGEAYYDLDNSDNTVSSALTLTAKWVDSPVVSFTVNGYTYIDPQVVASGSTVTKPTDPEKTNYKFEYWAIEDDTENEYYFNTPVTENITLVAVFTADASWAKSENLLALFDLSSSGATISLTDDEIETLIDLAASMEDTYNESVVSDLFSATYTVDPADLYLLAVYNGVSVAELEDTLSGLYSIYTAYSTAVNVTAKVYSYYVVTFENGDDTFYQVVRSGKSALEPSVTSDDGDFIIWYNGSDVYSFSSTVSSDLTLKAEWYTNETYITALAGKIKSDIKSKLDSLLWSGDVTAIELSEIMVYLDCEIADLESEIWDYIDDNDTAFTSKGSVYDALANAAAAGTSYVTLVIGTDSGTRTLVKNGEFTLDKYDDGDDGDNDTEWAGWLSGNDGYYYEDSITISEDVTLTATWIEPSFTVTFTSFDGSTASAKVTRGDTITGATNTTHSDYDYYWVDGNGNAFNFNSAIEDNITLIEERTFSDDMKTALTTALGYIEGKGYMFTYIRTNNGIFNYVYPDTSEEEVYLISLYLEYDVVDNNTYLANLFTTIRTACGGTGAKTPTVDDYASLLASAKASSYYNSYDWDTLWGN